MKGTHNAYVILQSVTSGNKTPVILRLDHSHGGPGRLTYRQLHQQLRSHFQLEKKFHCECGITSHGTHIPSKQLYKRMRCHVMMSNANRSGALLCFIANMIEDGSHPKIDVESGWPIVDCGFARSFFLHGGRGVSARAPSREVRIFLDMRWCQTPLQGQVHEAFPPGPRGAG